MHKIAIFVTFLWTFVYSKETVIDIQDLILPTTYSGSTVMYAFVI